MLRIAIVDENEADLNKLETLVKDHLDHIKAPSIITLYPKIDKAIKACSKQLIYDIVFIAFKGDEPKGLKLAQTIRSYDTQCKIVVTSESEEYAYISYRINAFNYVLKPFDQNQIEDMIFELNHIFQKIDGRHTTFHAKSGYYRLKHKDIIYVESQRRQVFFHLKDSCAIMLNAKLDDIQSELSDQRFLRCHKSYLVNMDYIHRLEKRHLYLYNSDAMIVVPKEALHEVKTRYFEYLENIRS